MTLRWEIGGPESRVEAWWQLFDRVTDPPVASMPAFFLGTVAQSERPSDGPPRLLRPLGKLFHFFEPRRHGDSTRVLYGFEGERLRAVVPVCVDAQSPFVRLSWSPEHPTGSWLTDLASPGAVLADALSRFSAVEAVKMPQRHASDFLAASSPAYWRRAEGPRTWTIPVTPLSEFLQCRSRNFRTSVRQARSLARREGVTVRRIASLDDFEEALPRLIEVSEASWQGQEADGTFARAGSLAFYGPLCRGAASRGRLDLRLAESHGRAVGFLLHIRLGRRLECLKSEQRLDCSHLRTGWIIQLSVLETATDEGIDAIGLGLHETRFKADFGVAEAPTVDVQVFRGAGRALFSLYVVRERTVRSRSGARNVALSPWL